MSRAEKYEFVCDLCKQVELVGDNEKQLPKCWLRFEVTKWAHNQNSARCHVLHVCPKCIDSMPDQSERGFLRRFLSRSRR